MVDGEKIGLENFIFCVVVVDVVVRAASGCEKCGSGGGNGNQVFNQRWKGESSWMKKAWVLLWSGGCHFGAGCCREGCSSRRSNAGLANCTTGRDVRKCSAKC